MMNWNRAVGSNWTRVAATFLVVLGLSLPSVVMAATQTARLSEIGGVEVRTTEVEVLRTLLESDLIAHPNVTLLSESDHGPADMEITGSLTRLSENYLVVLTARFESGEQRSRRHKIATFDEIDVASQRLVAALIENVELFATAERGAILEQEQEPETVVKSTQVWEIGLGSAWPVSDSLDDHGTMYGFHGTLGFEVREFLVDLRTDFQFGNDDVDTFAFTTTIGGRYLWYDGRRFGLYSGVEVGYGYVVADQPGHNPDRGSFLVGGSTGILSLRHSDINLDLRLRVVGLVDKLQGEFPVLVGLGLGLRF